MFYFFYKIIILIVNKEKDDIRSAYCKFSQLRDSQTTLLTPFRASLHYENSLVDQSKCMYYPNYFITHVIHPLDRFPYGSVSSFFKHPQPQKQQQFFEHFFT